MKGAGLGCRGILKCSEVLDCFRCLGECDLVLGSFGVSFGFR